MAACSVWDAVLVEELGKCGSSEEKKKKGMLCNLFTLYFNFTFSPLKILLHLAPHNSRMAVNTMYNLSI